jgi:anti-sigma B factor antagonist
MGHWLATIYPIFMVPIALDLRLSISMQPNDTNWQLWQPPQGLVAAAVEHKEPQLKLSLETRNLGDVMIVHCQGRIVYRDEAASLSQVVEEILDHRDKVVLDLSGVQSIDSAGIGELVLLYTRAQEKNVSFKVAGANTLVRTLLDLTNVDRVLDVHPSIPAALDAFREEQVCADC